MSRKWKIVLGVLAVIIVFCLWYTRPRSFDKLVGDGEFQNFAMTALTMGNKGGKMVSDSWQLDSYEGREETARTLRELLQGCQYRVSLRSLLPFSNSGTVSSNASITAIVFVVGTENGDSFSAVYNGAAATFYADRTIVTRASDPDISEKLLAFAQEYGWKSDS